MDGPGPVPTSATEREVPAPVELEAGTGIGRRWWSSRGRAKSANRSPSIPVPPSSCNRSSLSDDEDELVLWMDPCRLAFSRMRRIRSAFSSSRGDFLSATTAVACAAAAGAFAAATLSLPAALASASASAFFLRSHARTFSLYRLRSMSARELYTALLAGSSSFHFRATALARSTKEILPCVLVCDRDSLALSAVPLVCPRERRMIFCRVWMVWTAVGLEVAVRARWCWTVEARVGADPSLDWSWSLTPV
mmetsp:Transcript_11703/g.33344  ORF Transcript_11703/g.33344 Transcript_11703/m.33344 type:complete len:250 (+) Transcript_11703:869-1618(+)